MLVNPDEASDGQEGARARRSSTGWSRRKARRPSPTTRSAASSSSSPTRGKRAHERARHSPSAMAVAVSTAAGGQEPSVRLYAAGSLRAAMTEIAQAFAASGGPAVTATYGASGLLRERIEKGEAADVFASADVGQPAGARRAPAARRRRWCSRATGSARSWRRGSRRRPRRCSTACSIRRSSSAHRRRRPIRPGDYAWQLFEKAEKLRPGAFAALDAKALKLTGGPDSPPPPADRSIYGVLIAERQGRHLPDLLHQRHAAIREVAGRADDRASRSALPSARTMA